MQYITMTAEFSIKAAGRMIGRENHWLKRMQSLQQHHSTACQPPLLSQAYIQAL